MSDQITEAETDEEITVEKSRKVNGRPTLYRPHYNELVVELAKKGYTFAQICSHLNIARFTLYQWAIDHPGFSNILDQCREHAQSYMEKVALNHQVENKDGPKLNTTLWNFRMSRTYKDYKDQAQVVVNKTEDSTAPEELKERLAEIEERIRGLRV